MSRSLSGLWKDVNSPGYCSAGHDPKCIQISFSWPHTYQDAFQVIKQVSLTVVVKLSPKEFSRVLPGFHVWKGTGVSNKRVTSWCTLHTSHTGYQSTLWIGSCRLSSATSPTTRPTTWRQESSSSRTYRYGHTVRHYYSCSGPAGLDAPRTQDIPKTCKTQFVGQEKVYAWLHAYWDTLHKTFGSINVD